MFASIVGLFKKKPKVYVRRTARERRLRPYSRDGFRRESFRWDQSERRAKRYGRREQDRTDFIWDETFCI